MRPDFGASSSDRRGRTAWRILLQPTSTEPPSQALQVHMCRPRRHPRRPELRRQTQRSRICRSTRLHYERSLARQSRLKRSCRARRELSIHIWHVCDKYLGPETRGLIPQTVPDPDENRYTYGTRCADSEYGLGFEIGPLVPKIWFGTASRGAGDWSQKCPRSG